MLLAASALVIIFLDKEINEKRKIYALVHENGSNQLQ
jgi:hypothetical protein